MGVTIHPAETLSAGVGTIEMFTILKADIQTLQVDAVDEEVAVELPEVAVHPAVVEEEVPEVEQRPFQIN